MSERPWKTKETRVSGEAEAQRLAMLLIRESRWFEVTPLPDDEWLVVTKDEAGTDAGTEPRRQA